MRSLRWTISRSGRWPLSAARSATWSPFRIRRDPGGPSMALSARRRRFIRTQCSFAACKPARAWSLPPTASAWVMSISGPMPAVPISAPSKNSDRGWPVAGRRCVGLGPARRLGRCRAAVSRPIQPECTDDAGDGSRRPYQDARREVAQTRRDAGQSRDAQRQGGACLWFPALPSRRDHRYADRRCCPGSLRVFDERWRPAAAGSCGRDGRWSASRRSGVTPTIEVPFVYAAGRDPQLDRAVQVLSDRIRG